VPRKHQGAISLFDTEFVNTGLLPRSLSADLHLVFNARQEDDYRAIGPVPAEDARTALESAARFVQSVRDFLAQAMSG